MSDAPQGFFFDTRAALARIKADRIEALQAEALDWRAQVGELSDKCKAREAENARLRALLLEAASDLTVYVNSEYPLEICEKYPDIARRHHRDLELVRRISAALAQEGKE